MAQKPENRMISRLKPLIQDAGIYVEKQNNPYLSGPPDLYLESFLRESRIEAKFFVRKYVAGDKVTSEIPIGALSPLQYSWIKRRVKNGLPTGILVGYSGGVVNKPVYGFFSLGYDDGAVGGDISYPKKHEVLDKKGVIKAIVKFHMGPQ